MIIIYCSRKLSDFLGQDRFPASQESSNSALGDWNGHLFFHQRRKYLMLVNNKTYYALLFPSIKKADLRDFESLFLQRLLQQLVYDEIIKDDETLVFLQRLLPVTLAKTNNDKKAIGTLNEFIFNFTFSFDYFKWANRDLREINAKLNDTLVGASRKQNAP